MLSGMQEREHLTLWQELLTIALKLTHIQQEVSAKAAYPPGGLLQLNSLLFVHQTGNISFKGNSHFSSQSIFIAWEDHQIQDKQTDCKLSVWMRNLHFQGRVNKTVSYSALHSCTSL